MHHKPGHLALIFALLMAVATAAPAPPAITAVSAESLDAEPARPLRRPFPINPFADARTAPLFPLNDMMQGSSGTAGAFATATGTAYGTPIYATWTAVPSALGDLPGTTTSWAPSPTGSWGMAIAAVDGCGKGPKGTHLKQFPGGGISWGRGGSELGC